MILPISGLSWDRQGLAHRDSEKNARAKKTCLPGVAQNSTMGSNNMGCVVLINMYQYVDTWLFIYLYIYTHIIHIYIYIRYNLSIAFAAFSDGFLDPSEDPIIVIQRPFTVTQPVLPSFKARQRTRWTLACGRTHEWHQFPRTKHHYQFFVSPKLGYTSIED